MLLAVIPSPWLSHPAPGNHYCIHFLYVWICLFWVFYVDGVTWFVAFVSILSLNNFSGFDYVEASISNSLLFIDKYYSIV